MIGGANQKPDKLAQRIAARRAAVARESASDENLNRQMASGKDLARSGQQSEVDSALEQAKLDHIERGLDGAAVNANCDKIVWVSKAIASGENPITVARLLAALELTNKELSAALGKSKAWVSKRLGLLEAPIAVQRLIESGELSESEYYNNRRNIQSGIKNTNGMLKYQRIPTIEISLDAARSLAMILSDLAAVNGAAPIWVEPDTNKKRIVSILNERASEILKALK